MGARAAEKKEREAEKANRQVASEAQASAKALEEIARLNPRSELEKRSRKRSGQRERPKRLNAIDLPTKHGQEPHPMPKNARKPRQPKNLQTGRPKRKRESHPVPRRTGQPKPPRILVDAELALARWQAMTHK